MNSVLSQNSLNEFSTTYLKRPLLCLFIGIFTFSIGISVSAQIPNDIITALKWNSSSSELAIAGIFSGQTGIQLQDNTGMIINFISTPALPLSISWSSDDTYIATTFRQGEQYLTNVWDNSGIFINSIAETGAKTGYTIHWSPQVGSKVFATEVSGIINIWNSETGVRESVIAQQGTSIISFTDFTWNISGTEIFTLSNSGSLSAWDANTLTFLREINVNSPIALSLSPDGTKLGVSSATDGIIIFDEASFNVLQVLQSQSAQIMALRWSPDNSQLVSSDFSEISTWDLYTGNVVNTLLLGQPISDVYPQALDYSNVGQLTYLSDIGAPVIAPISNAGSDQLVNDIDGNGSEVVILDASASSDSDGTILNYQWSEDGVTLATGDNPQVTLGTGTHNIILKVTDNDGAVGTDTVTVTVNSLNATPTPPPSTDDFTMTARINGQDDNQQSLFAYMLTNDSSVPQSNIDIRVFFTPDNGRSASDYEMQSYYDSSSALIITGPTQWDANNYYFTLDYGSSTLAVGASYEFQGVIRLSDYGTEFASANDWWRTGLLPAQDSVTDYLPVYSNGALNIGLEPSGSIQPTSTPAPTNTPIPSAVLNIENRIDGVDNNQQSSFRYRLTNVSTQPQGNISIRFYFTLDGSQIASDYVFETYYDQSGLAAISGPTLMNGNVYYFQIDYGSPTLQPNSTWEFQGALHLVNYAPNFDSSNDWWHTSITSTYTTTDYLPAYINGSLIVGQEP